LLIPRVSLSLPLLAELLNPLAVDVVGVRRL
jgi:hypothetical protein